MIPMISLVTTEYRASLNAKIFQNLGWEAIESEVPRLKLLPSTVIDKVIRNTGLLFSLQNFHSEASAVFSSGLSWMFIFLTATANRRITKITVAAKTALRTTWERMCREKQLYHHITTEPVNPRERTANTFSFVDNSRFPLVSRRSK